MSEIKMNKTRLLIIPVLLITVLIMGALLSWQFINGQMQPVDPEDKQQVQVRIPENSSAQAIAAILHKHNLIRSEGAFLNYCRYNKLDSRLKAGLYTFSRSQDLKEIATEIAEGKETSLSITIPEGYNLKQIGQLLVSRKICTAEDWQLAITAEYNYDFIKGLPPGDNRLEGYLFPDTYKIEEKTEAQDIVDMMLANFSRRWSKNFANQALARNLDMRKVIIIASLIEKEARVAGERKRISGVIQNRLQLGMPLQICSTVNYCLGTSKEVLTYKDLEVDSPYNTYRYTGLPPGPIASPGQAAIEAALYPEAHHYYYFVSKGDGSHYFSRTFAEHSAAQQKYENQ
jgi:UPF0755 protein